MERYLFAALPVFSLVVGEVAARGRRLRTALVPWAARPPVAIAEECRVDRPAPVGQVELAALHDLGVALHGYRASIGAAIPAERPLLTIPVHDVRRTAIPARADGRYFVVLWPGEVLSLDHPPTAPPKYVESNRQLRERMERLFGRTQLVEVRRQPDGSALLELWRAEDPLPRLRFLPEHREDVDTDEPGS